VIPLLLPGLHGGNPNLGNLFGLQNDDFGELYCRRSGEAMVVFEFVLPRGITHRRPGGEVSPLL
jgi:hypothetical protein